MLAHNQPAEIPPTLYINNMTKVQYAGAVSMAMEGMRLFCGDMDEDQEGLFEARWRPLFRYPSQEIVFYLNQLNPLLLQFLTLRSALNDCIEDFNATQLAVMSCTEIGDAEGVSEAMEDAVIYALAAKELNARLQLVGEKIIDLGEPPDAAGIMKKARQQYEAALKEFSAKAAPAPAAEKGACWTLVECRSFDEVGLLSQCHYDDTRRPHFSYKINLREGRLASKFSPPSWAGPGSLEFGYRHTWERPPLHLHTGEKLTLSAEIERVHSCAGLDLKGLKKITQAESKGKILIKSPHLPRTADYQSRLDNCGVIEYPGRVSIACPDEEPPEYSQPIVEISVETYPNERRWARDTNCNQCADGPCGGRLKNYESGTRVPVRMKLPKMDSEHLYLYVRFRDDFTCVEDDRWPLRSRFIFANVGIVYVYQWDPTGNSIKPLDLDHSGNDDDDSSVASGSSPEKQEIEEKITFHRHNSEYFSNTIEALNKQIANAANPEARNRLTRNLLYAKDARQRELDAITALKTGNFVRTRTELDAFNMQIMARQSEALALRFHREKRIRERGPRLIGLAPPADRGKLLDFFKDHVLYERDVAKMSTGMKALGDKVLGGIEAEIAAHEEDARYWDENLRMAQYTKAGADYAMLALSFTGAGAAYNLFGKAGMITASGAVYMAYNAVNGYLEGGVEEAVSGTLAAYNAGTAIIHAGMQGYQAGVLRHLEEYSRNPQKIALDEEKAGFKGAAWSAGTAAAFACAVHFGMKAYNNRQQIIENRKAQLQFKCEKAKRESLVRYFKKRTVAAAKKVKTFRQRQMALSEAAQANAPKNEIARLRNELDQAYKGIKTDYFAKKIMKSMAVKAKANFHTESGRAHHKTVHAYNSIDRRYTKQLKTRLSQRMDAQGFNPQRYKTFSNSASKGGIAMDVDVGAIEPPRYIMVKGKRVANPEHAAWRRGLTRAVDGVTRRASPHELQEVGQQELEHAFQDVFGRKPDEAMLSYTTSYHPEAYRDPRWLGSKRCKTALVNETDPQWTQQAADVTDFKVNTMDAHNPSLGYYGRMQEKCRGLVKDFDTKLEPLLARSKNQEAVKRMRELRKVMEQFSSNKIGPVKAEQMLRLMTGNKDGLREVSQRFSVMLQGLKK
ncbi:MAG: hypothetical protein GXO34_04490 [Deltaproteobacteria bacterium]|nr:hypothetical protein [Deltaproteobacteria bacterium]